MTRALLLLDVDGPLHPWAAKPERRPHGYLTHRLKPGDMDERDKPLRVWLAPEHGPMLLRFAEQHDVELVWCTTWEHDANTMIGPNMGLPELPVIEFQGSPINQEQWKYPAVLEYAGDRPLIWFDDGFKEAWLALAKEGFLRARGTRPTLLHQVDPRIGLNQLDLNIGAAWLDREVPRAA